MVATGRGLHPPDQDVDHDARRFQRDELGNLDDGGAVAGQPALVQRSKAAMIEMMRGKTAYLAHFARYIDQFAGASAGMLTSLMASVGVGTDLIDIKKTGTFPIVHGIRTLSIERGIVSRRQASASTHWWRMACLAQSSSASSRAISNSVVSLAVACGQDRSARKETSVAIVRPERALDLRPRPPAQRAAGGKAVPRGDPPPL